MENRRVFIKSTLAGIGLLLLPGFDLVKKAFGQIKRKILSKDTDPTSLRLEYPAALDTKNLSITPIEKFSTMGETQYQVDLASWRLTVNGKVNQPLTLSYQELLDLESMTKNVLLICPGVFSQNGQWRGVSLRQILDLAGIDPAAEWIEFEGEHRGRMNSKKSYSVKEAMEDKVFLAYDVNGQPLPIKHGYPLRVVAVDHFGGDWVKYVHRMTVT